MLYSSVPIEHAFPCISIVRSGFSWVENVTYKSITIKAKEEKLVRLMSIVIKNP